MPADREATTGADPRHAERLGELVEPAVLQGVQRRERPALERFFEAAFPFVYGLAHRLTGDRSESEDVTQEVFLKLHRAAERIDPGRDVRPWLTRITFNSCRDHLRKKGARRGPGEYSEEVPAPGPASETPQGALLRKEQEDLLQRALYSLDEKHRSVVLLRDYAGCSHDQLATILGMSPGAVRKRYSRALEKLRALLMRYER